MIIPLLIGILLSFLFYIAKYYYRYYKKESIDLKKYLTDSLLEIAIALLFFFIFFLIVILFFADYTALSIFNIYVVSFILVKLIKPKSLYYKIVNKTYHFKFQARVLTIIVLVLLIALELFYCNSRSFKNDYLKIEYTYSDLVTCINTGEDKGDKIKFNNANDLYIRDINQNCKNIHLTFAPENTGATIFLYCLYFGEETDQYQYIGQYQINAMQSESSTLGFNTTKAISDLHIIFYVDNGRFEVNELLLESITINDDIKLDFNILRLLVIFGLCYLLIYLPQLFKKYALQDTNKIVRIEKCVAIGGAILVIVYLIYIFFNQTKYFINYPLEKDIKQYDIYVQLFDALRKGQLHLDVGVDPKLAALENPYLPQNRYGVSYLFDHAFYKGKYYCYYGIMPVLLVTFPLYFITGKVAIITLLQELAVLMILPALLLAILEMLKTFVKRINYPVLYFFLIVAIFTALVFSNITYKKGTFNEGIYSIPIAYGNCFIMLFLFFAFKAYNSENKTLPLALSGLFIAMTIASRPNLFLFVIFTIPLYLAILFRKVKFKQKLKEFMPMILILIVSATLICLYNYKRYESITEFGQFYQLTVADNTALKITPKSFLAAIVHFFLQPFRTENTFPYILPSDMELSLDTHNYTVGNVGIFMIPLFLMILFIGFAIKKEDKKEIKFILPLMTLVLFALVTSTYSFAGVCPRYMVDIYPLCTLISIITIFKILSNNQNQRTNKILLSSFIFIGLISMFITFNHIFNTFNGLNYADLNGLLFRVKAFFMEYNA